jgi:hypothetical protein
MIAFTIVAGISVLAGLYLSKAVARVPGNENLEQRIEFNELTREYMPRWMYLICSEVPRSKSYTISMRAPRLVTHVLCLCSDGPPL